MKAYCNEFLTNETGNVVSEKNAILCICGCWQDFINGG